MAKNTVGRKDDQDATSLTGRFYAALAGLSTSQEPRQRYRRQVMGLLQGLSSRLRARGNASANGTGYHASVHYIVILLYRANAEHTVRVREIQRGLGYTAGGVTRRIDAMVRDGLLVRLPDPTDGRALLARLTPDGAALAQHLLSFSDERSKRVEDEFTADEWETLAALLGRLERVLDETPRPAPAAGGEPEAAG